MTFTEVTRDLDLGLSILIHSVPQGSIHRHNASRWPHVLTTLSLTRLGWWTHTSQYALHVRTRRRRCLTYQSEDPSKYPWNLRRSDSTEQAIFHSRRNLYEGLIWEYDFRVRAMSQFSGECLDDAANTCNAVPIGLSFCRRRPRPFIAVLRMSYVANRHK